MQIFTVDQVFDLIGHLGRSQIIYFVQLSLITTLIAEHMLLNVYTGLQPSFSCHFKQYGKEVVLQDECPNNSASNCKLIFNETHSTYISEWNLVCDQMYKIPLCQSIWMGGIMAGSLTMSTLADTFGRQKSLAVSLTGLLLFDALSAFAPSYDTMVFCRFLSGMCCSLVIITGFVLSQELIGLKWRSFCALFGAIFFSFGIVFISMLAAYIHDWRSLTFITSISGFVFLLTPCFVPESPRWLLGNKRPEEAKRVLKRMAIHNNTSSQLPTGRWGVALDQNGSSKSTKNLGFFATVFSHWYIVLITLIQVFSWFVNSAVYYALTMSAAQSTHGSVYWATSINGLIEIPSNIACIYFIEKFGRKATICGFMVVGGAMCMAIPLVPPQYGNYLALVGKLGIAASFSVIFLHSGEVFPTMIRNTAMGMLSCAARIGGIISPFILLLGEVRPQLHFVVLGALSFLSGLMNLKLPETLGLPLPETISDVLSLRHPTKKEIPSIETTKGYTKLRQEVAELATNDDISSEEEEHV